MLCLIALWCCFGTGVLTPFLAWSAATHIYCDKRNFLHKKKVRLSGLVWDTNMAAVSLFWREHQYGGPDVTWKRWLSKTFPRCISTKYLPSLNTTSKWPAANCESNKLFHKGAFDWLYSRIKLYADISDKFLWTRNFGPFQCYIHLNSLFPPKFLILPCIWSQTRFFQSLFHLFWFRNTFNRTSRWLRAFSPLIPVPPDKGKADSDCGIHDSVYEVPAA